jgi:CRP/FNR family cyclic AMP-dependent transcriptional regulator
MQTLDQLIADAPIFSGLDQRHLELIAGCGGNEHADAGAYLYREGQSAECFYLIREGAIALEIDAPGRGAIVVETLGAGEITGFSWLFEPFRWQFDARAIAPVRLVGFDGLCLRNKCEADHELGYQLMRRFATTAINRLQATRLQLLDVYGNPGAR